VVVAVLAELWWIDEKEKKKKKKKKKVTVAVVPCGVWRGEWQWRGGSDTVGKRRSRRFEWYQWQCGSSSIGRVVVD
jgi:hypothetical protein